MNAPIRPTLSAAEIALLFPVAHLSGATCPGAVLQVLARENDLTVAEVRETVAERVGFIALDVNRNP
ncbi:MAG: hypothetical protein OXQ92_12310 [Boseongicola sp.]|nr:hypothetical protein [Boseongicola sp.]MDD9976339.1 hypothetical protein [Boseongicola sp.]